MSVNDNKMDFLGAVSYIAEEWRARSFESCVSGFMKSMITQSVSVDVPKGMSIGEKERVLDSVKSTIDKSVAEFTKSAFDAKSEYGALFNVDIAHEITSPKNLNESVVKLLSQHIFDESKDRAEVLAAEFDAGTINNFNEEQAVEHIRAMYDNPGFDSRFDNGVSFRRGVKELLSVEGEVLVDEIKDDVANLVNETEAKNSVIREAVAEINSRKAEIEEQINGESEEPTDKDDDSGSDSSDDSESGDEGSDDSGESGNDDFGDSGDSSSDEGNEEGGNDDGKSDSFSDAASSEGWYQKAVKNVRSGKIVYTSDNFIKVNDHSAIATHLPLHSNEALNLDRDSFSREAAENILEQFRDLEDGISSDEVPANENTLSVSDSEPNDNVDKNEPNAESAEGVYDDDENQQIEVDSSAFEYTPEEPDILKDDDDKDDGEISEEAFAKKILPLNLNKVNNREVRINKRLPIYLAMQPDHGAEFFDLIRGRYNVLKSKSLEAAELNPDLTTPEDTKDLDQIFDLTTKVEKDTKTITEDLGILGILGNKFQRTGNNVDNAVISLFNAKILSPMGVPDAGKDLSVSTEKLYEHDLAEIFKLAVKKADITIDLTQHNGIDIVEKKDQLGYIDELIDEKMFSMVKPEDKDAVEEKIKALYSLECICPVQEIANIQAFVSSENPDVDTKPKILLDRLQQVDAYGFSFADEIQKIKTSVKAKYEQLKNDKTNFNFDTDTLVEMVADENDTTKINANLFEKTLSKLSENRTIENATEALILRNTAKAIVTSYITAEKLGYLRESDIQQIQNYVM